ncbi:molybdopterin cofactor-binding domain-containing protein [Marinibacterium sp. SX1]|uniref:xanthine dehydrogenase family protein molybdopterin-binding subunit n=1 Tax=Marinibacterium sp. SX1 TaxID=3388424 RepID=UPI003D174999
MARIATIARRSFLIGSAAIAGGVAFGFYKLNQAPANPLDAGTGQAALNPFIFIDGNGVTIITPRAEMGQGVQTTLAALAAEELDIAWQDVRVLHGPPAAAYYNAAMVGGMLPFKEYQMTGWQHMLAGQLDKAGKFLSLQVTGGSTSMRDGFDRLREAGASARETLKQAASDQLGIAAASLRTEDGQVIAPDGTALPYGALAEAAARIDPPRVALRDPSQWRYLGHSMPRLDQVPKVTGTAQFGIDTRMDGMKFATLRQNPARAGMLRYDASAAETMPGVEKIVPLDTGIAVIASNTWLAFRAAEAIEIEWEGPAYPPDQDAIWSAIEASLDQAPNSTLRDDGDADELPEGATLVEAEYRMPFLAHATMEPMNATALFSGDALLIRCGNQAPVMVRDKCAEATGLDPEQVTVETLIMGGGFGRRGEVDYAVLAARVAQAMPGTPIQLTWSREEDMTQDFYRPAAIGRFRGAVRDGRPVLLDGRIAGPSVNASAMPRWVGMEPSGPDKIHVEGAYDQPYAIENYRITGHLTDLSVPLGYWRSVGASVTSFLHETFIDELAVAAGRDPLDMRLELMRNEHAPSAACLDRVAEMAGWTGQTPEGIGRGVAFSFSFGTPVAEIVEVEQTEMGIRIARAWVACDVGLALDPAIVRAQMMSGLIYGLSAAVMGEITFAEGAAEQQNFYDYDALRMHNTPVIDVAVLENKPHLSGAGEPGTPPSMPALGNALFDLTGRRARELPLNKSFDFLL